MYERQVHLCFIQRLKPWNYRYQRGTNVDLFARELVKKTGTLLPPKSFNFSKRIENVEKNYNVL